MGLARIQFGDRSQEYRDQEKALAIIDAELATVSGTTPIAKTSIASFSRD